MAPRSPLFNILGKLCSTKYIIILILYDQVAQFILIKLIAIQMKASTYISLPDDRCLKIKITFVKKYHMGENNDSIRKGGQKVLAIS